MPHGFSFSSFSQIFQLQGIWRAFLVSVLRTVIGTVLTVISCGMLGYLFTQEAMPCRKYLYRMLIITMYVGGGLIPVYLTMKSYHLLNNFWVYILPYTVSAYNVILIKTFIEQLPRSLEESAMIDGAGYIKIFTHIIVPLSKPVLATVAMFAAVGQWNAWFDNNIYMTKENLNTLQYLLYQYLNESQRIAAELKNASSLGSITAQQASSLSPKAIRMAITIVASMPIFMVYPFMQRYFVKGITLGAVKQ
ncbi:MAG: carbohydrate ABC transporter permease [Cellulosilyticaceae bacterium]